MKENSDGSKKLFLHVFDWPEEREIKVNGLEVIPSRIYTLETGQQLSFVPDHGSMVITLPNRVVDENITVIVVDVPEI